MLRATVACELAGVPATALTCDAFIAQFKATSVGLGMKNASFATVPGHPGLQSDAALRHNTLTVTLPEVIQGLTSSREEGGAETEPGARDIVFQGGFSATNAHFHSRGWSDGLPIVPPTRARIEEFLRYTDRDPDEILGIPLPARRAASVWSIAVNGVMAGCLPRHMPVLVALVEAMLDSRYGVEHSGNTPGAETLIILNGPIIQELEFNYTQGVMRDGVLANTAIGRFWRLYLRNIAGFMHHSTDKATFGNTWRVVVPENEEVLTRIGWPNHAVAMGLAAGDNAVTIARYVGGNLLASVSGSTPEQILPYVAEGLRNQTSWTIAFTIGVSDTLRPLVMLSPILAETIARAGWSKADVQRFLFEHSRIPAWQFERMLRDWTTHETWSLADEVARGRAPALYHASDDPERLVPLVWRPEDIMLLVTGDPGRNNAYVFAHNGAWGYPVARRIVLPARWPEPRA